MKEWFIRLFHALMPMFDPERQAWREEMERQYEASLEQNRIERVYLSTTHPARKHPSRD